LYLNGGGGGPRRANAAFPASCPPYLVFINTPAISTQWFAMVAYPSQRRMIGFFQIPCVITMSIATTGTRIALSQNSEFLSSNV
jgi:hypothetical protein